MTLQELYANLTQQDADASLIFATTEGEINGNYHITELKSLTIESIDCGGSRSQWQEAALQLLDGRGGEYMTVGKFTDILRRSLDSVENLRDLNMHVEFAHGNVGMRRFEIGHIDSEQDRVVVSLNEDKALCKPSVSSKQTRCCA